MKGTISYNGTRWQRLEWWRCEKTDAYDQWQNGTRVAVEISYASKRQKRLFRQHCNNHSDRWGMYYDCVREDSVSFRPKDIQTVFKLYGPKTLGGGPDLVGELVQLLDGPRVRGGFQWVEKMKKLLRAK